MESTDIVINREIGQLLYDVAPNDARKIIMRAKLADEGDVGEFEFDYENEKGDVNWFTSTGKTNSRLLDLLERHRAFFVSQNQSPWKACTVTIDVETGKFSMNLKY
jgi:hypothetical protein